MSFSTAIPIPKITQGRGAALFCCAACAGWHMPHGYRASPYQVHRRVSATMLICDACSTVRPILIEGEALPVTIRRWPELPKGFMMYPPSGKSAAKREP